jgi:hypothetical protein
MLDSSDITPANIEGQFFAYNAEDSMLSELNEHIGHVYRLHDTAEYENTLLHTLSSFLHETARVLGISSSIMHFLDLANTVLSMLPNYAGLFSLVGKIFPIIDFGLTAATTCIEDTSVGLEKLNISFTHHTITSIEHALSEYEEATIEEEQIEYIVTGNPDMLDILMSGGE